MTDKKKVIAILSSFLWLTILLEMILGFYDVRPLFGIQVANLRKGLIIAIFVELTSMVIWLLSSPRSDTHRKIDDYSKSPVAVWSQIAATGLIGLAGIAFTVTTSVNESKRQQSDMATQLMASREKSETDFRQNMFTTLIAQILSHKSSLRDRYASFELFQNNFNDLFNSRSLYDALWFASLEQLHDTTGKI